MPSVDTRSMLGTVGCVVEVDRLIPHADSPDTSPDNLAADVAFLEEMNASESHEPFE